MSEARAGSTEALQYWLASELLKTRDRTKDASAALEARARVTGNTYLAPVEQVEIYREQFWYRHTGSLVEDFPGLSGVLGQADWDRLIVGYLERHPPRSFSLRDLGDRLAEYIEAEAGWLEHRELCTDMARLEWSYVEIFDAKDVAPLDPAKLLSMPPEAWAHAVFRLNPALRQLSVRYPVAELRRALRRSQARGASATDPVAIPERKPERLVLYRNRGRSLAFEVVTPAEFALLAELREGVPLGQACENIVAAAPDLEKALEEHVGTWCRVWGERQWVVDVEGPET